MFTQLHTHLYLHMVMAMMQCVFLMFSGNFVLAGDPPTSLNLYHDVVGQPLPHDKWQRKVMPKGSTYYFEGPIFSAVSCA